jgi:hypothetical protein
MRNLKIDRNPEHINDELSGRRAYYKGGTASPAVWYWDRKFGDKQLAIQLGYKRKDIKRMHGWRLDGNNQIELVCGIGNYYYCV